eukprot:scaffold102_cov133-Isochrysis_galbana.AAC.14
MSPTARVRLIARRKVFANSARACKPRRLPSSRALRCPVQRTVFRWAGCAGGLGESFLQGVGGQGCVCVGQDPRCFFSSRGARRAADGSPPGSE